jgi:alginate O-acetyltransferase complex protein AlgJ
LLIVLAAASVLSLIAFLFTMDKNIAVSAPYSVLNNIRILNGVYVTDSGKDELKVIAQKVKLNADRCYQIKFSLSNFDQQKDANIYYGFVGEKNDYLKEYSVHLLPGERAKKINETVFSGAGVPENILFRVFYSGPNQVRIKNIRVAEHLGFGANPFSLLFLMFFLSFAFAYLKEFVFSGKEKFFLIQEMMVIAVFLVLIILPELQGKFGFIAIGALDENRKKAAPPHENMIAGLISDKDYSKKYEKYYNDTFGFRDLLIKLKNQLDYSLFGKSDEVVIGKNGWMEYKSVLEVEEIRADRQTEKDWLKISENVTKFNAFVNSKGAKLILAPIGQKFTIYPEFNKNGTIIRPSKTSFDKFVEIAASNGICLIDINDVLREKKKEFNVFYKTDFHWNEIGAFFASEEMVNSIASDAGSSVKWVKNLQYTEKKGFFGGLNRSLALLFPPEENQIEIVKNWNTSGKYLIPKEPFLVHYKSDVSLKELLPKTLVIGNSFSTYYLERTGFYEYFNEAFLLHSNNLNQLEKVFPAGVKFVVLQIIEVDIGNRLWNDDWWPQYSKVQR